MQLSDKAIRALKPKEKPYKATDGQGLYILVTRQGSRLWRFDYRFQGKRQTLSLGKSPDIGLADARLRLADARQLLAQGRDPVSVKQSRSLVANDNFAALAEEWLTKRRKEGLAPPTIEKYEWFIRLIHDDLGRLPVRYIGTAEVLRALRRFEARVLPRGEGPASDAQPDFQVRHRLRPRRARSGGRCVRGADIGTR